MKKVTLKSEFFRRSTRFTHRFDEQMQDDPCWPKPTFSVDVPVRPDERRSAGVDVQQRGEADYFGPLSGVVKPDGQRASISGPRPDYAEETSTPVPMGTKKRKSS